MSGGRSGAGAWGIWLPPALRPLRHGPLALLWAGLATSAVGDQLFAVALSWIAVQVMGRDAGYLTAVQPASVLIVALVAGHWADRVPHRGLMIGADLCRAGVLLGLIALWLARGAPPIWALVGTVVVLAAGQALFRPAVQALLPRLVGDASLLPAANGLLETTERIARLVGPGLVGMLAVFVPMVHYVSIDVATFVASALAVLGTMRLRPLPGMGARPPAMGLASMWHGFAVMARHPVLALSLLFGVPGAGIWYAVLFLAVPLLLTHMPGHGLPDFGLVLASYGLGNIGGALFIGGTPMPRRAGRMVFAADLVLGGGLAAIGAAYLLLPGPWVLPGFCVAAAFSSVGGPMSDIPVAVLRQTRLRPEDQAAAMRATLVSWNVGILIALAGAPLLFGAVGVAPAVLGGGLVIVACGVAGLLRTWRFFS